MIKIWVLILKGTTLIDWSALEKRRQKEKEGRRAGLPAPNGRVDVHRINTTDIYAGENWLVFMSKPTKDHSVWTTCNTHRKAPSGSGFEQIYCRATITTFNNHTPQCYNNAHRLIKEAAEFLENSSWVWVDVLRALRLTNRLSRLSCSPGKRLQRPRTLI